MGPDVSKTGISRDVGLPKDVQYLVRKYPRDTWVEHLVSNTAQTWLGVHRYFRTASKTAQAMIEDVQNGRKDAAEIGPAYRHRIGEILVHLDGHHKIEDNHYFPQFEMLEPGLKAGFELMEEDHHVIDRAIFEVSALSRAFLEAADPILTDRSLLDRAVNELGAGLAQFRTIMLHHLDDEEDLVIPLIIDRNIA
jgi:hypothetical protein